MKNSTAGIEQIINNNINKYLLKQTTTDIPTDKQMVSTGINTFVPTDISTVTNKKYDNDFLFEQLGDLVNPSFRAWYCKVFFELGKDEVMRLASVARADGNDPRRLFSHLLKQGGLV